MKYGKAHLDAAFFGLQALDHFLEHRLEAVDRELALLRERISTKRDMCVPLNWCGRPTYMLKLAMVCCAPPGRSMIRTGWRIGLDAHLVDRELARIVRGLDVGNVVQVFGFHGAIITPD